MAASEKIPLTEARRHGRHRILLAATLHSVHGETGGVLLDLSEGGALVNASPPLPPGCKLLLERQNFEVPGTVRWVEGNRFGVQFDEPITAELVDALVTRSGYKNAH